MPLSTMTTFPKLDTLFILLSKDETLEKFLTIGKVQRYFEIFATASQITETLLVEITSIPALMAF